MFSHALLIGLISEKGVTRAEIASAIGISKNALINKLKGRTCFSTREIAGICKILGIDNQSIGTYFFTPKP